MTLKEVEEAVTNFPIDREFLEELRTNIEKINYQIRHTNCLIHNREPLVADEKELEAAINYLYRAGKLNNNGSWISQARKYLQNSK